jgi:hypothetical protein
MTVTLPLLAFLLLFSFFAAWGATWRKAFLLAALSWGVLLTASTELLSLFQGINHLSLTFFWGAVVLGAGIGFNRSRQTLRFVLPPRDEIYLCIPIVLILLITGLTAVVSPPNNWDSMTYHMGRVVHWIQNHSVAHYPTNIIRQLYFAPWAEFAIMHLQILSGSDYFANLVQWFALCGCLIGVSLIAGQFGADRFRQIFAAVLGATIPMAILQSSSTQNDLVAAFWLVCFVYFSIAFLNTREKHAILAAGAALGLAILTKGTAYIYALPFVLWFFWATLRIGFRHLVMATMVATLMVLILNGGHYARNTALWGNPLAEDIDQVQTTRRDMPALFSNIARNTVANTWTSIPALNMLQYRAAISFHTVLGIDASEPSTSLHGARFVPGFLSRHEDLAGNGLHTIIILATLPVLLLRRHRFADTLPPGYVLGCLSSLILFCLILKWQPWITRLQLPGFMLAFPLVAVAMPGIRHKWCIVIVMVLLLTASAPWLLRNESRPLIGEWTILNADRNALYFASNPGLLSYYDQISETVINTPACTAIGVSGDIDAYEYPLWALVKSKGGTMPRIEHVNVTNISRTVPLYDFAPCMLIKLLQVAE